MAKPLDRKTVIKAAKESGVYFVVLIEDPRNPGNSLAINVFNDKLEFNILKNLVVQEIIDLSVIKDGS